jgi:hypothetical protein
MEAYATEAEWYKNGIVLRNILIFIVLIADLILNNVFEPPPNYSSLSGVVALFW